MAIYFSIWVQFYVAKHLNKNSHFCRYLLFRCGKGCKITYLHSDDGINEEKHRNQQANIREGFKWLDKCPKQYPNGVSLSEKFDQSSRSKQPQEAQI